MGFFNACSTRAWVSLPHLIFPAHAPPHARCGNNRPVSANARTTLNAEPVRWNSANRSVDRAADLLVGVLDDLAVVVVDEPDRQRMP